MVSDISATLGLSDIKKIFADRMDVSNSRFYWYRNQTNILKYLLEERKNQNTAQIIRKCQMPFANITEAVCKFFQYFIGPTKFDLGFDFTIRKRSQRDSSIRKRLGVEGWSCIIH